MFTSSEVFREERRVTLTIAMKINGTHLEVMMKLKIMLKEGESKIKIKMMSQL